MTCPNCGQEYEGARCSHCGRPSSNTANRVIAVILAIFLVLPLALALAGACSVWGGMNSAVAPDFGGGIGIVFLAVGAVSIAAFVGLAYVVAKLWRG